MTDHDPAAVEVLTGVLSRNGLASVEVDEVAKVAVLDALTAANLAVVGEGQALIGGKVVRLDQTSYRYDPDAKCVRAADDEHFEWDTEDDYCPVCQTLYVIREDGAT